jgi:hypothetical protein
MLRPDRLDVAIARELATSGCGSRSFDRGLFVKGERHHSALISGKPQQKSRDVILSVGREAARSFDSSIKEFRHKPKITSARLQSPNCNIVVEISRAAAKPLVQRKFFPMFRLAQIARACGRVSVGGNPGQEAGEPS